MEAYQRYGRALLRKAERMVGTSDAHDVVQALFVDLLQRGEDSVDLAYLYRAVTNRCITLLRGKKNRARLLAEEGAVLAPPPRTACDEQIIDQDLLVKLVRELDEAHGEVLAYRYVDDMTQEEIATLLGLSRKTIGHRLDRIREVVARIAGSKETS